MFFLHFFHFLIFFRAFIDGLEKYRTEVEMADVELRDKYNKEVEYGFFNKKLRFFFLSK